MVTIMVMVTRYRYQRSQPKYKLDLGAWLSICDSNYHLLMCLFPNLDSGGRVPGRLFMGRKFPEFVFEIVSRHRYTSEINISCKAPEGIPDLSMRVRVYHDLQTSEVIEYQKERDFMPTYEYPNEKMRMPNEKVQVNRFLSEVLDLCANQGAAKDDPLKVLGEIIAG